MAYDMAGVTEPRKQIHIAEPYDPFDYKELHHLEGLQLFDKGKAPEAARGRGHRARRRPAVLSLGRAARRRQSDRGCGPDEDRRALLAAPRRGRRASGTWDAGAGSGAGVGRPDAGGHGGRDGGGRGPARVAAARPRRSSRSVPTHLSRRRVPRCDRIRRRLLRRSTYEWDAGEAMGAFLEGLRDGRIVATYCASCERTLVPPRKFCERCFRPTDRWTEVDAVGAVETFSICHVTWDMRPVDPPELPAVIRLDGASEGGFLHKLGEVSPDDVSDRDGGRGGLDTARANAPARSWTSRTSVRATEVRRRWPHGPRRDAGRVPLHARRWQHRVLRSAPRPWRVARARAARRATSRTCPPGSSASAASPSSRPTPSAVPAGRSSRSRSGTSASTANRWTSRSRSGSCKLDGADTVLMHRLVGYGPWAIAMRVDAVLAAERTGSISDIVGFNLA